LRIVRRVRSTLVVFGFVLAAQGLAGCGADATLNASADPPSPQIGEGGVSLVPLEPDPAFAAAARAECLTQMVADPNMPLVVHDQRRADLAAFRFEGTTEYLVQLVERRGNTFICSEGGGGGLPGISGVALTITDWQIIGEGEAEGWMVSGYVDPNATQVRIRRVAGPELLASVGGGRFVAFWIGPSDVSSMTAFDRTGREIARVDDPMELGGGVH
jgi:hypothetical protein